MDIQKIPAGQLKAAKYNPRKDLKPGDAEYEKLRRSVEEFGYVEPVIWNKRYCTEFGLTPAARLKLAAPKETIKPLTEFERKFGCMTLSTVVWSQDPNPY